MDTIYNFGVCVSYYFKSTGELIAILLQSIYSQVFNPSQSIVWKILLVLKARIMAFFSTMSFKFDRFIIYRQREERRCSTCGQLPITREGSSELYLKVCILVLLFILILICLCRFWDIIQQGAKHLWQKGFWANTVQRQARSSSPQPNQRGVRLWGRRSSLQFQGAQNFQVNPAEPNLLQFPVNPVEVRFHRPLHNYNFRPRHRREQSLELEQKQQQPRQRQQRSRKRQQRQLKLEPSHQQQPEQAQQPQKAQQQPHQHQQQHLEHSLEQAVLQFHSFTYPTISCSLEATNTIKSESSGHKREQGTKTNMPKEYSRATRCKENEGKNLSIKKFNSLLNNIKKVKYEIFPEK